MWKTLDKYVLDSSTDNIPDSSTDNIPDLTDFVGIDFDLQQRMRNSNAVISEI